MYEIVCIKIFCSVQLHCFEDDSVNTQREWKIKNMLYHAYLTMHPKQRHKLKALSTETSYVMTLIYRWLQYSGLDGGIWRQRTG